MTKFGEEAGSGALRGGGWVVELVREIGGELAKRVELFRLLFHTRDFADSIHHRRDDTLRHGRDGSKHRREEALVNLKRPAGSDGVAIAAVGLHAREGELAGHCASAADPHGHGAAIVAAHVDLTFEDEDHAVSGTTFSEDHGAVFADALFAVGG